MATEEKREFEHETIDFPDGTNITIYYPLTGKARYAMIDGAIPDAIRAVRKGIMLSQGHCCKELLENLGNHDLRPAVPVLITPENWGNGRFHWRYPGATRPGYYIVREIKPTEAEIKKGITPDVVYVPMGDCPFCGNHPISKNFEARADGLSHHDRIISLVKDWLATSSNAGELDDAVYEIVNYLIGDITEAVDNADYPEQTEA